MKHTGIKKWFQGVLFMLFPFLFLGFGLTVLATANLDALNDLCRVNNVQICRYMGVAGSTSEEQTLKRNGKTIKLKNTGDRQLFIPNGSPEELDAFLTQRGRSDISITVCEEGLRNDEDSAEFNFGASVNGIKGCDAQCVITPNYGEKCVVKSGFIGKRLATQGLWIDGTTNFDWDTSGMVNYWGDDDNHYYTGNASNKTEKRRCGPANGYNVGNYGYRPTSTGWYRYQCDKWDCFWGCNYGWKNKTFIANATKQVYEDDSYYEWGYGYECTKQLVTYSGSYTAWCENSNNEGLASTSNGVLDLLQPSAEAESIYNRPLAPLDPESSGYECQKPCSDYNYYRDPSEPPRTIGECGTGTVNTGNTQMGICFSGSMCNSQNSNVSNCTNYNSNCEVVNDGSVTYSYSNTCTFDWEIYTSSYTDSEGWNTCSNTSGTQWRSVSCKDEDSNYASHDKCDASTKPTSSQACTAYRWINDDYYSGCTAKCNDREFLQNEQKTNPLAFILYSGVANAEDVYHRMIAPVDGTYTVSGTEYKKAYCYRIYDYTETKVDDSFCAGQSKYEPSRTCTRTCESDTGGQY